MFGFFFKNVNLFLRLVWLGFMEILENGTALSYANYFENFDLEFAIIFYHTETECYLNSMITVRG